MKFGLIPINVGVTAPEQIITTVQTAEAQGSKVFGLLSML